MKTVITKKADGTIFTKSEKLNKNGEEHGFIRVESQELSLGFAQRGAVKRRSALIDMPLAIWNKDKAMIEEACNKGIALPGAIVRHNSLKPFYTGQKPLQTSEGQTITANGQPVYRNEFYTEVKSVIEAGDKNLDFEAFDVVEKVKAVQIAN